MLDLTPDCLVTLETATIQQDVLCATKMIILTMQQGFQGLEHRCKVWAQESQQGTT